MEDTSEGLEEIDDDEFELDYINQNSCMIFLTEAIQKLHNKICPPSASTTTAPSWMTGLLHVFESANVKQKTYIAKLIANYPFAFEKHANIWIVPLMNFIIEGGFGDPINYLVQDLAIRFIVWGKETSLDHSHSMTVSRFLVCAAKGCSYVQLTFSNRNFSYNILIMNHLVSLEAMFKLSKVLLKIGEIFAMFQL